MSETTRHNEQEMRDAKAPQVETTEALAEYIEGLLSGGHDYGTCVYAMSMAATAAFYLVAHKLGVTGFQASCADMDIIRRTRGMKGPFAIIDGNDMLYPQYDIPGKVNEMLEKWMPWAAGEAKKMLAERSEYASPGVVAHWEFLAKMAPESAVCDE